MSVKLLGRAFYAELPAHLKLTLLALADEAGDDGRGVCLGQERLARKVGASDRTVRENLSKLRAEGWITRLPTKHPKYGTDQYEIDVTRLSPEESSGRRARGDESRRPEDPAGERPEDPAGPDEADRKLGVGATGGGLPPTQDLPVEASDPNGSSASVSRISINADGGPPTRLSKKLAPRKPDLIFEILFSLDAGVPYTTENRHRLTASSAGILTRVSKSIADTGITPEELADSIAAWPEVMDDALCTAQAVERHLPRLRAAVEGRVFRAGQGEGDIAKLSRELERPGRESA